MEMYHHESTEFRGIKLHDINISNEVYWRRLSEHKLMMAIMCQYSNEILVPKLV
jgi:hypothetical protein